MTRKWLALISVATSAILMACVGEYGPTVALTPDQRDRILFTATATVNDTPVKTIAFIDPQVVPSEIELLNENSLPGAENPIWSTSHERILYTTRSEQGASVWTVDANGTNSRLITHDLPFDAGMNWGRWSFDDQYIAFRLSKEEGDLRHTVYELRIQEIDGEHLTVVPDVWAYAWAPNDHRIAALVRNAKGISLQILRPNGTQEQIFAASSFPVVQITSPELGWSPDGHRVLLVNQPSRVDSSVEPTPVSELFTLDVDSDQVQQLTDKQHELVSRSIYCVSWSPDGRRISFVADYKLNDGVLPKWK